MSNKSSGVAGRGGGGSGMEVGEAREKGLLVYSLDAIL